MSGSINVSTNEVDKNWNKQKYVNAQCQTFSINSLFAYEYTNITVTKLETLIYQIHKYNQLTEDH